MADQNSLQIRLEDDLVETLVNNPNDPLNITMADYLRNIIQGCLDRYQAHRILHGAEQEAERQAASLMHHADLQAERKEDRIERRANRQQDLTEREQRRAEREQDRVERRANRQQDLIEREKIVSSIEKIVLSVEKIASSIEDRIERQASH